MLGKPRLAKNGQTIEQMFNKMNISDRNEILDKIHRIRMRAFDDRGFEDVTKPHVPQMSQLEKDKIVEQYYAAKKQLTDQSAANASI
jgi:hypothetical protein